MRVPFTLRDGAGALLTTASPNIATYIASDGSSRTTPTITNRGNGTYDFTVPDVDAALGIAYEIDSGAGAYPARLGGAASLDGRFQAFAVYDASGLPQTGLTPTFSVYQLSSGATPTPPTISSFGGGLYGFVVPMVDALLEPDCVVLTGGVSPDSYDISIDKPGASTGFGAVVNLVRKPKIFWPYTLDYIGTHKWIDFLIDSTGTSFSVDVTTFLPNVAGPRLADFMNALVEAVYVGFPTAPLSWTTSTDGTKIGISYGSTGLHMSNNGGPHSASNFFKYHLGFANVDFSLGASPVYGSTPPSAVWMCPVAVKYDSQDEFDRSNDAVTIAVSGKTKYLQEAVTTVRQVSFGFLPPEYTRNAKATAPQRTLEGLWRDGASGFEYWNDQSLGFGFGTGGGGGYTDPAASYGLTAEQYGLYSLNHDTVINGFHPKRLGNKELYSLDLGLYKYIG